MKVPVQRRVPPTRVSKQRAQDALQFMRSHRNSGVKKVQHEIDTQKPRGLTPSTATDIRSGALCDADTICPSNLCPSNISNDSGPTAATLQPSPDIVLALLPEQQPFKPYVDDTTLYLPEIYISEDRGYRETAGCCGSLLPRNTGFFDMLASDLVLP